MSCDVIDDVFFRCFREQYIFSQGHSILDFLLGYASSMNQQYLSMPSKEF